MGGSANDGRCRAARGSDLRSSILENLTATIQASDRLGAVLAILPPCSAIPLHAGTFTTHDTMTVEISASSVKHKEKKSKKSEKDKHAKHDHADAVDVSGVYVQG